MRHPTTCSLSGGILRHAWQAAARGSGKMSRSSLGCIRTLNSCTVRSFRNGAQRCSRVRPSSWDIIENTQCQHKMSVANVWMTAGNHRRTGDCDESYPYPSSALEFTMNEVDEGCVYSHQPRSHCTIVGRGWAALPTPDVVNTTVTQPSPPNSRLVAAVVCFKECKRSAREHPPVRERRASSTACRCRVHFPQELCLRR